MKRYTDEELSRILSCAAVGELGRFRSDLQTKTVCIEQAATASLEWDLQKLVEDGGDKERGNLYDSYRPQAPAPHNILSWCEKQGLA